MNLQQFIAKYNGVGNVGNTPENKGECVGLVMVWAKDQNLPHVWGHAKDLLVNADRQAYEVIDNTPTAVVEPGDIVVWKKEFNSTFGHTAIAVKGTLNTLEVFEQNNPLGSACHLKTYKSYAYIDGWLRPKSSAIQAQNLAQDFNDQTVIPANLLGTSSAMEIQAIRGKLGDLERTESRLTDCITTNNLQAELILDLRTKYHACLNKPAGVSKTYTSSWGKAFAQVADFFG